jgi:G3E family GTPase
MRILRKLMRRSRAFDAVMIETTGLADPAPVIQARHAAAAAPRLRGAALGCAAYLLYGARTACPPLPPPLQTFFMDDDLREAFNLDAVITVVDAAHVVQHLEEEKPDGVENESGARAGAGARGGHRRGRGIRGGAVKPAQRRRPLFGMRRHGCAPARPPLQNDTHTPNPRRANSTPHPETRKVEQIAFADRIVLNKLDLVTPEQKADIIARIKARAAPRAPRRREAPVWEGAGGAPRGSASAVGQRSARARAHGQQRARRSCHTASSKHLPPPRRRRRRRSTRPPRSWRRRTRRSTWPACWA